MCVEAPAFPNSCIQKKLVRAWCVVPEGLETAGKEQVTCIAKELLSHARDVLVYH